MPKLTKIEPIVSAEWLANNIDSENLLVFDATITKVLSKASIDDTLQIPKAQFFDIKKQFSNTKAPFPNTIPSEEQFEKAVQQLGVNQDSIIVFYDTHGIYSSPRAWWLFKTFGFNNVAILNGGLPEWIAQDLPLENKSFNNTKPKGNFKAVYNKNRVVYFNDLEGITENKDFKIIDARSSDRFNCVVPEPRKGLRSGTIPSSSSLPYTSILSNGKLISKSELKAVFKNLASKNQHLVFTCGSGITASVLALAASIAEYKNSVYDGSWTEYGSLTD